MGFRFRRSMKILPGLRVNLSKTGISTSIGRPGATINLRGDKVKATVGLPGTGLSYSETASQSSGAGGSSLGTILLLILLAALVFGFLS